MRELLSYLPQNNMEEPPAIAPTDPVDRIDEDLNYIVPENPNKPYDMKEILAKVLDDGQFLEVQALYATNMLIGFGRLNGKVVGIVANQPRSLAGVIDTNASNKAARFVRT